MEIIKTPHISAPLGAFAKTVLMPGDPLRSQFVAETFLEDARLVNNIRGIQGYTGYYEGTPVSVMASGMGIPSMGIYSHELFSFFGVENIIRIGTAGGFGDEVRLGDILICMSASTDSSYPKAFAPEGATFAPTASYELLSGAVKEAEALKLSYKVGSVLSSDVFYADGKKNEIWKSLGVLGVDMETAALYTNASLLKKRALTVLSVSDHVFTGESLDAEFRRSGFTDMMKLALNLAKKL